MAKRNFIKIPKKPKGITPEFEDEVLKADTPGLKNMIVAQQKYLGECEVFLKDNPELKAQRERLKDAESPTRDAIKVVKNRTKHIIQALKEHGQL